jgi:hypothetical protein
MSYIDGTIMAPVSMSDVQAVLGNNSNDLMRLVTEAKNGGLPVKDASGNTLYTSAFYINGVDGWNDTINGQLISGAEPMVNIWSEKGPTYIGYPTSTGVNTYFCMTAYLWNKPDGYSVSGAGNARDAYASLGGFDRYDHIAARPTVTFTVGNNYLNVTVSTGGRDWLEVFGTSSGEVGFTVTYYKNGQLQVLDVTPNEWMANEDDTLWEFGFELTGSDFVTSFSSMSNGVRFGFSRFVASSGDAAVYTKEGTCFIENVISATMINKNSSDGSTTEVNSLLVSYNGLNSYTTASTTVASISKNTSTGYIVLSVTYTLTSSDDSADATRPSGCTVTYKCDVGGTTYIGSGRSSTPSIGTGNTVTCSVPADYQSTGVAAAVTISFVYIDDLSEVKV